MDWLLMLPILSLVSETSKNFRDVFSTFLFLAMFNKSKKGKGPKNALSLADQNSALFDMVTNSVGTAENVLFWSQNQNLLLKNDFRRLKLTSNYGTGSLKKKLHRNTK